MPACRSQFWKHFAGVVAALASDDDVASFQRLDIVAVEQTGFVFGHGWCCTAGIGGRVENRFDQIEIIFCQHAVHEDRADHAAPTNQSYAIAYFFHGVALSVSVLLTPGSFGREGHDEPWLVSRWSWFWWKCQTDAPQRSRSWLQANGCLAWFS